MKELYTSVYRDLSSLHGILTGEPLPFHSTNLHSPSLPSLNAAPLRCSPLLTIPLPLPPSLRLPHPNLLAVPHSTPQSHPPSSPPQSPKIMINNLQIDPRRTLHKRRIIPLMIHFPHSRLPIILPARFHPLLVEFIDLLPIYWFSSSAFPLSLYVFLGSGR